MEESEEYDTFTKVAHTMLPINHSHTMVPINHSHTLNTHTLTHSRALACTLWSLKHGTWQEERQEFIFHIFTRCIVGGSMCQFDDQIEPYLEMTKSIYKDMISVQKNATTKELQVG
jgi:hypothetical protein